MPKFSYYKIRTPAQEAKRLASAKRGTLKKQLNKECVNARRRALYQVNKEHVNTVKRAWYDTNLEKSHAYAKKWRDNNYTIKKALYDRWVEANRDRVNELGREWRKANPDKVRRRNRNYRANNPDKAKSWSRKWRQAHPEAKRASGLRYRTASCTAPGIATSEQIKARVNFFGELCSYCLTKPYEHLDHAIPLSRGGTNWPANLRPACQWCNLSKGTMTAAEYLHKLYGVSVK